MFLHTLSSLVLFQNFHILYAIIFEVYNINIFLTLKHEKPNIGYMFISSYSLNISMIFFKSLELTSQDY
jgi:hypothetical protein